MMGAVFYSEFPQSPLLIQMAEHINSISKDDDGQHSAPSSYVQEWKMKENFP